MRYLLGIIVLLLCVGHVAAAEQAYSAQVDGAQRDVAVPVYYADEAPYLPLFELAGKLGGSARLVTPSEAEVTINGVMATLSLNSPRYRVGQEDKNLTAPFLPYEAEVLAPQAEMQAFFQSAFGVTLAPPAAPAPAEPAEENDLLEPVAIPAPETPADAEPMPLNEDGLLETDAIAPPAEPAPAEKPLKFATLVVDPGHGGTDVGAQGAGGLMEKDVTLGVALALAEQLKDSGIAVVLTRSDDKGMSNSERGNIAADQDNAFVLSIHAGASLSPQATGLEAIYSSAFSRSRVSGTHSRDAAQALITAVSNETEQPVRGVRRAPLQMLPGKDLRGCLLELGCLSNADDEQFLANEANRTRIARALAAAVKQLAAG